MSGSSFDDLARTLSEPMPRRRALRLAGAAMLVTAFGGLGPSRARAGHEGCPQGFGVPCGPNASASIMNHGGASCCGHIGGVAAKCCPGNPDACCGADAICSTRADGSAICRSPCPGGGVRCGSSGLCCQKDQVCEPGRGICCPLDEDAPECVVPETQCAQKVEDLYKLQVNRVCRKSGKNASVDGMREAAFFSLGCEIAAYAIQRRGGLNRCPKTQNDAACGPNGRCDTGTGRCAQPDCGRLGSSPPRASQRTVPASYRPSGSAAADEAPSAAGAARDATVTAIRRALRRRRRALQRDADRLSRAYDSPAAQGSSRASAGLLAALAAYRRDIRSVRRSVARIRARGARGRKARALVLKSLDAAAAGLQSSRLAALAPAPATAKSHAQRARSSFTAGGRSAKRARAALGCGRGC